MSQTPSMGDNRTGIVSSEGRAEAMQKDMERFAPTSHGTTAGAGKVRAQYAKEGNGQGLGSVPKPTNLSDASLAKSAKVMAKRVAGKEPTLLMDKLGERCAFERTGTRLYEALLSKLEATGSFTGGPTREGLLEILNQEHAHFSMLTETIAQLAGDPTAMTPSADLAATAASGIQKVVTDPRTSLVQSLEAILIAELTDRDGWESLIELARAAGEDGLAERFADAERTEEEHLTKVRGWLKASRAAA